MTFRINVVEEEKATIFVAGRLINRGRRFLKWHMYDTRKYPLQKDGYFGKDATSHKGKYFDNGKTTSS